MMEDRLRHWHGWWKEKYMEVHLETEQTKPKSMLSHSTNGYLGPTDQQALSKIYRIPGKCEKRGKLPEKCSAHSPY